jgi:hypothetical protein
VKAGGLVFKNKLTKRAVDIVGRFWFWIDLQIQRAVSLVTRAIFKWIDGKTVHLASGQLDEIKAAYDAFTDRKYVWKHIVEPQRRTINAARIDEESVYKKARSHAALVCVNVLDRKGRLKKVQA